MAEAKHTPTPAQLRFDAHAAYLDGRAKRARELNREADKIDAKARAAIAKATGQ